MLQPPLFHGDHLPPRCHYRKLFDLLPSLPSSPRLGRPCIDSGAMLHALIYRCLRRLPTLSDLVYSLRENLSLFESIGFLPFAAVPPVERFSVWLRSTANESLQEVRLSLLRALIEGSAVRGSTLCLDSCPIPSPVRENNLKTTVRDRFNKDRLPKGDPDARLGAYRIYPGSGSKKVHFFWGYRNHIAVDYETELPLWEQTLPANIHETRVAIPLLESCACQLHLPTQAVCADSAYDSEAILAYIIETLHAQAVVAPNERYQPKPDFRIQGDVVLCPANLAMIYRGRMTPKRTGITYHQYSCPLHYSKTMGQRFLLCPANHPKFLTQKGCNYLRRISPSHRSQIAYGSSQFVDNYKKRTSVERVFSRLLSVTMQRPTVVGLQAIRNSCTIAHITVLLVALAAHQQGDVDKLAFVRSYVPNFMTDR